MYFLIELIDTGFQVYTYILLARIIMSWVPQGNMRGNVVVDWLYRVTEPVLAPARRIIPPIGMLDISPIVVFILLDVVRRLLHGFLLSVM